VQFPLRWSDEQAWKRDDGNVDNLSPEVLTQRWQAFDAQKVIAQMQQDGS